MKLKNLHEDDKLNIIRTLEDYLRENLVPVFRNWKVLYTAPRQRSGGQYWSPARPYFQIWIPSEKGQFEVNHFSRMELGRSTYFDIADPYSFDKIIEHVRTDPKAVRLK